MPDYLLKPMNPKGEVLKEVCHEKQFVLASGCRLSTKCVSPDTLIWTSRGLIPIGNMGSANEGQFSNVDYRVSSLCKNGLGITVSQAAGFYNSGTRAANRIRTSLGYELTCSPEHPVWSECCGEIKFRTSEEISALLAGGRQVWVPMVRENKNGWGSEYPKVCFKWSMRWEAASTRAAYRIEEAMLGGAASVNQIVTRSKAGLTTVRRYLAGESPREHNTELVIDEDIGYFLGVLVGDGCYSPPVFDAKQLRFSSSDGEIVESMKRIVEGRFTDSFVKFAANYDYDIRSSEIRFLLEHLGMARKYAHEKSVPEVILQSPKSVIVAFLQGLFDTDGMVCKNGYPRYCTSSDALSRQVQSLLLGLGIRCSRRFYKNARRGAWIIAPRDEDGFGVKIGFRLKRKQERLRSIRNYHLSHSAYPPSLVEVLKRLHATRKERGVGTLPRKVHRRTLIKVLKREVSLSEKRIRPLMQVLKIENCPDFQAYWMGGDVWWDRIESCSGTVSALVDLFVPETSSFVGNGFINHNTVNGLFIICDHAWNTRLGNIALVTITQTAGVDSGVWQQLTEMVIPTFGLKYKRAPYIQGTSKKPCCSVINKFGEGVKITLESLKIEDEAEMRFKSKTYSMIFVTELDNFKKLKTFLTWTECLRMPHLSDAEHLFLADCNPSDEGTSSWIYKLWFEHGGNDENMASLKSFIGQLGLVEFDLNDNIYSTPNRIQQVKDKYSLDPDLYKRYVLGLWVTATENALFARVFKESLHVIGEVETRSNPTPELLLPEPSCIELGGGWDLGVVNNAFVIIEKFIRDEWFVRDVNGKQERVMRSIPYFKWLDELVLVDEDILMEDFVAEAMNKMRFWEKTVGRPVQWTHWSDRSAFDMSEPLGGRYQHQLVAEASGGKIKLMAAMEGRRTNETVRQRIDLMRKLLFQSRMYFSAAKTPKAIDMCKGLQKGRGAFSIIQKTSKHKHVFDAGTYYIATECFEELNRNLLMGWEPERRESGVVAVGM